MNEINEIKKQFTAGQWKKFLKSIKISNLRGWNGQSIDFRFPVCAIVGENGIGKSTFLRAAASAYDNKTGKSFYPSNLFIKTQWDTQFLNEAKIEYVIQEGERTRNLKWKKTNDWGFTPKKNKPKRHVFFLDISRTLPLDATAGYARIAKLSNEEGESNVELNEENLRQLSYVLGKNYSNARFTNTNISTVREVGLLTREFGEISQFHQGAGEDTTLDMFKVLQTIPEQSLLIIDEVEASLHPSSQRRLVKFLIHLARIRKIQIIISAHSPFILDELPPEGRILIMQLSDKKDIVYEVSSQFALTYIDDLEHPELYVFLEDKEAEKLFLEIIKQDRENCDRIIMQISTRIVGASNVVSILGDLSVQNKLPYRSVALIDGDKQESEGRHCIFLPGNVAPEKLVFSQMKSLNWNNLSERFGIGAGTLYKILDDAMLLPDHHDWTKEVGDYVKQSKDYVWSVMVEEWCKQCLREEDRNRIVTAIKEKISI